MKVQKLKNIIRLYKSWKHDNPDSWIEHCYNQSNIDDTIKFAALSRNNTGRKHPHQRRIKNCKLQEFAEILDLKKAEIVTANNFDELLEVIESCNFKSIGPLACYDIAIRIGERINQYPDAIYLHAGTRIGAEKILGERLKSRSISREILPIPFHDVTLTNAHIEDILCIYKKLF